MSLYLSIISYLIFLIICSILQLVVLLYVNCFIRFSLANFTHLYTDFVSTSFTLPLLLFLFLSLLLYPLFSQFSFPALILFFALEHHSPNYSHQISFSWNTSVTIVMISEFVVVVIFCSCGRRVEKERFYMHVYLLSTPNHLMYIEITENLNCQN